MLYYSFCRNNRSERPGTCATWKSARYFLYHGARALRGVRGTGGIGSHRPPAAAPPVQRHAGRANPEPALYTCGPIAGCAGRRSNRLPRPPAYLGFSSRGTAGWNAGVWVCVAQPTAHTPQTPQLNTGSSNRRRSAIVFWSSSCIFFSCRSTCVLVAFWFIEG